MDYFAVSVILYNPSDVEISRLKQYTAVPNTKVLIFDNSNNSHEPEIKRTLPVNSYHYFFYGNNVGISKAYNVLGNWAISEGACQMLCLDQDSALSSQLLSRLIEECGKYFNDSVGMICATTEYSVTKKSMLRNNNGPVDISFNITSGSVLNLNVFKLVGGFDEELFIDGVDRDYCLTLIKNHYQILELPDVVLDHKLGDGKRNPLGVYEHSALRNYYIYRNRLYLLKKHGWFFKGVKKLKSRQLSEMKQLLSILLFEHDKLSKLHNIRHAIRDYRRSTFGRYTK